MTQTDAGVMENLHQLWTQSTSTESTVVILTSTFLLLLMILGYWYSQSSQSGKHPPGPRPWPIVGNFPSLSSKDSPHRTLYKLSEQYGGLMYLRMCSVPCIVLSNVAVAQEFFTRQDANFSTRPKRSVLRVMDTKDESFTTTGPSLFGPHWRSLRKFCKDEMFSPKCLEAWKGVRMEEIEHMTGMLMDDAQKGRVVNLKERLWGVTANTVTRIFCNRRFYGPDMNQHEKEEFEMMISGLLEAVGAFVISDYIPSLWFITYLQGWEKKFERIRDVSARLSEKIFQVEKHKERISKAIKLGHPVDENYVPDFVDVLLTKPLVAGEICCDDHILALLRGMLNAGTDTSATMVEWIMAELVRQPHFLKRAQKELDAVVGSRPFVQESDLNQLPFLQAIIKEGFRLHPPTPLGIFRESLHPCEFQGYKFPAKTLLMHNIFAIQRDPAVYTNPDEFNPERFVNREDIDHLAHFSSFELTPFGVGRRMCPGYALGNLMVLLLLANLLFQFDWSLPGDLRPEDLDTSEAKGLVVWLKNSLCLIPTPRTQLAAKP